MNKKSDIKKKVTNEKPITLSSLNFKDAIEALLKVKPEEEKKEKIENNKRSN